MAQVAQPRRGKDQLTAISQALGLVQGIQNIRGSFTNFNRLEAQFADEKDQAAQLDDPSSDLSIEARRSANELGLQGVDPNTSAGAIQRKFGDIPALMKEDRARRFEVEKLNLKQAEAAAKKAGITAKPPSASQFEAGAFAKRAGDADKILANLSEKGFDATSLTTAAQRTGIFPEKFKSEDVKSFQQSQRNFINSILRRESGAAIAPSEFESAEKQYFPQVSDTPANLKQKANNRAVAIAALKAESGDALALIQAQITGEKPQGQGPISDAVAGDLTDLGDKELEELMFGPN